MAAYKLSNDRKQNIQEKLVQLLERKKEIVFAYLHGSFLSDHFKDIDIAIYLSKDDQKETLLYELDLEADMAESLGFPTDIRTLNFAPLSFRFNVIKNGILLFSKDDILRSDFECLSIVEYHDFDYFRKTYRKEVLGLRF